MFKPDPELIGEDVVIDTSSPIVYIGRLAAVEDTCLLLEDVDVHDINDTSTTKDIYILEARKFGVKKNRIRARLSLDQVVSLSKLDEVIEY